MKHIIKLFQILKKVFLGYETPPRVGVDIGCRMALSIYDIPEKHFYENESKYKRELIAWTKFGAGNGWDGKFKAEHEILDSAEFNMTPFINNWNNRV